ncbi:PASTA domain-containing protein [Nonomuraea indica]|uniref:PASTA domain-containing protein n=1 Tax=Nonomuraea indica TaxID=1581193 RepID=UPI000C7E06E9|nr:PASTA domain-containing protein [Nonomuraea indica]
MASNSKAAGCLTAFVGLAIVGGCMQLFGYESESTKAAKVAETARAAGLPDLVGKTLTEVENTGRSMDVRIDDQGIGPIASCDDKTDCIVFRMSPKPGAVVEKFGEVAVTWATGEERAWYGKWKKMPKVIGWTEAKAERFFKPVEAAVENESQQSKKVPYGKDLVIAQSPKPGKPLKLGQKIRLVIGYNLDGGTTGTDNGNTDFDVNIGDNDGGESRFCRGKWYC